jgi:hypothetical protein
MGTYHFAPSSLIFNAHGTKVLCPCWQHGPLYGIQKDTDVPKIRREGPQCENVIYIYIYIHVLPNDKTTI